MFIKLANMSDLPVIHELMIQAFTKYVDDEFPSTALEETVVSINNAMEKGEQAFICYKDETPVGMIRFQKEKEGLYFYRLSVIPAEQGKGIAKKIVAHLEGYAKEQGVANMYCKVRQSETHNINLYRSIGYEIYETTVLVRKEGEMKVISMKKDMKKWISFQI